MPILNYSTSIPASKTVNEIMALLQRAGADRIMLDMENKLPVAVSFAINIAGQPVSFRLPCNVPGVQIALRNDKRTSSAQCTTDHARRVGWRILKDWIEAQLALVEAKQADLGEIFIPYMIMPGGKTVYQALVENNRQLSIASKRED